jgi:hypothetical protein
MHLACKLFRTREWKSAMHLTKKHKPGLTLPRQAAELARQLVDKILDDVIM